MKKIIGLIMLALLLTFCVSAMAEDTIVSFETEKVSISAGETAVLVVTVAPACAQDITLLYTDQNSEKHTLLVPAGAEKAEITVETAIRGTNCKWMYTLKNGEGYTVKGIYECALVQKGVPVFSFSDKVYQSFVGKTITVRLDVAGEDKVTSAMNAEIRDQDGAVLYTLPLKAGKTSYKASFEMTEDWHPGKTLYVWVAGRAQADSSTLIAPGLPGIKSIYGVVRDDNKIAYTMDCAYGCDNTMRILDTLDKMNVKITFFITGEWAENYPDMLLEIKNRGHEIACHSYSHPHWYQLDNAHVMNQVVKALDTIEGVTGDRPVFLRPPFGECDGRIRAIVNACGCDVIRWSASASDSDKATPVAEIIKNATKNLKGGDIILSHNDNAHTADALESILTWYRDNGFEVVKVSELLLVGDTTVNEDGLQVLK